MTPELSAIIALAAFALLGVAAVVRDFLRCGQTWQIWALYALERVYVPFMFHTRANRRFPIPPGEPGIILANHRSPVDPLMIWLNSHLPDPNRRIRMPRFMMAKEYHDVAGVGWITRNAKTIGVTRDGQDLTSVKEALAELKKGEVVGIFPEGRINKGNQYELLDTGTGVAWLALRAQVPVYPVFIHDAPQGGSMIAPFCTPSRVRVTFGDPIDLSDYYGKRKSQDVLREVTDLMMARLAEVGGATAHGPDTLPMETSQRRTG